MAQTQRRRNFSAEFKRKAVADARMLGIRAAGRKHGVSQVSVLKWLKSAEEEGKEMPKTGQSCPHCGRAFERPQALASHLRFAHADTLPSKTAHLQAKKKEEKGRTEPTLGSVPVAVAAVPASALAHVTLPVPVVVSSTGAPEHLKTALEGLTQRQRQVEEELSRMAALQSEKEILRKQIDALNLAMQAFGL